MTDEPGKLSIRKPRMEIAGSDDDAGSLADSLETARHRQLVYVDRRGEVRSARRYRNLNRLGYGLILTLGAGAMTAYGLVLGAGGVAIAAAAVALGSWPWWQYRRLSRGVRLLVRDELDAAEEIFERVARARLSPRHMRALGWQNLGAVSVRRGHFEAALERQKKARDYFGRVRRKPVFAHMANLSIVHTLVELDRVGEAGAIYAEVCDVIPPGKYLQIQLWSAELYIAFAEGDHELPDDVLYARSRDALQITSAVGLLLLLSWAHWKSGDAEQAGLLMSQAFDREGLDLARRTMPRLWSWVEAHRDMADGAESYEI